MNTYKPIYSSAKNRISEKEFRGILNNLKQVDHDRMLLNSRLKEENPDTLENILMSLKRTYNRDFSYLLGDIA